MGKLYVLNGLDEGKSFSLKEGVNAIGRSFENDIVLRDKTISRQHLRIVKEANEYRVADLASKNGTFFSGHYLSPETELDVKEGVPIVIGMTVVGIGEATVTMTKPYLESVGLTEETGEESGIFTIHRDKTNQKKLETLYKVSNVLEQKLPLTDALDKVVKIIAELLVEIETASVILIDPKTTKIVLFAHKSRNSEGSRPLKFSPQVLYKAIREKKSVRISDSDREQVDRELASTLKMHGISSVLCVPMISDAQVFGALYLHSLKRPYGFTSEDLSFFEGIAQRANNFVQYGQYFSELSTMMEKLSSNL